MKDSNPLPIPNSDERLTAALGYLFGFLGAFLVWALQKDKSAFVRFHAVQALAFEALVLTITMVLTACLFGLLWIASIGIVMAAGVPNSSDSNTLLLLPTLVPFSLFSCLFPFSLALFIVRRVAAVSVGAGRDFRYPWLGRRVEEFLKK